MDSKWDVTRCMLIAMSYASDRFLTACDAALRTLFATPHASKPCPTLPNQPTELTVQEQKTSAGLMRVNHVGEVCAQALYTAQALTTPSPALRAQFTQACVEETDHLAWTALRLKELGARPSLLNPLWYAGSFAIGLVAGRMGNAISLGFVEETEKQVSAHLQGHLSAGAHVLPEADRASRAIVAQMREDEIVHAKAANAAGAAELPAVVQKLMRGAAKIMTSVAQRI